MSGHEEQHGIIMADQGQRDVPASDGSSVPQVGNNGHAETGEHGSQQDALEARETLDALLRDLDSLQAYLTQRGRHTYDLAQKFLDSARRNRDSRAFDERQATMLEYQHYIWHEIAGMVNKLLVTYGEGDGTGEEQDTQTSGTGDER